MAIYHCSIKTVSRAKGRSAPAAAAYRAGVELEEKRTGEVHDFTRKRGVLHAELVLPDGVTMSRSELWNAAEFAETRKNSTVAREYEVALPDELSEAGQKSLARDFAAEIAWKYGVAADVCIHEPDPRGDQRNRHAHILTTTRVVTANGFGPKTRVLDERASGQVEWIREKWATMCNEALEREHRPERVSHLSLPAQGLTREPQQHQGPTATAMQRRGVEPDRKRFRSQEDGGDLGQEIADLGAELREVEQQLAGLLEPKMVMAPTVAPAKKEEKRMLTDAQKQEVAAIVRCYSAESEAEMVYAEEQGCDFLQDEYGQDEELMLMMQEELRLQLQAAMDQQRLAEAEERQDWEQEQGPSAKFRM
jgi:ATP-dependent exoDNAse (exonuclease V) alpha subunit